MVKAKNKGDLSHALISGLRISGLFGRYDYEVEFPRNPVDGEVSKVGIVYGDNGTGKTTILKLLFHLLSPSDGRGHRSALARIPFSGFTVFFSNRLKISVDRKPKDKSGPYEITRFRPGLPTLTGRVSLDQDGDVTPRTITPAVNKILDEIARLKTPIFFLRDDRRLQSDEISDEPVREIVERTIYGERHIRRIRHVEGDPQTRLLKEILDRTMTWLRRQLIEQSSRGEVEAQQIYGKIANQMAKLKMPGDQDYKRESRRLKKALSELERKSRQLAHYGLVSKINVRQMVESLTAAKKDALPFTVEVVRSFIEGQQARLEALHELSARIERFVGILNGFLIDKHIEIKVGEGIQILTDDHILLEPGCLSSGEKQLLLLLCNVLMSSDSRSLFLIDEPELSLNVKWQRKLIDSVLSITSGSQCQFLLATHSIELITKHKSEVIKLDSH